MSIYDFPCLISAPSPATSPRQGGELTLAVLGEITTFRESFAAFREITPQWSLSSVDPLMHRHCRPLSKFFTTNLFLKSQYYHPLSKSLGSAGGAEEVVRRIYRASPQYGCECAAVKLEVRRILSGKTGKCSFCLT